VPPSSRATSSASSTRPHDPSRTPPRKSLISSSPRYQPRHAGPKRGWGVLGGFHAGYIAVSPCVTFFSFPFYFRGGLSIRVRWPRLQLRAPCCVNHFFFTLLSTLLPSRPFLFLLHSHLPPPESPLFFFSFSATFRLAFGS
jgi:hypothetical protein